jgi:hypothetical protein
MDGFTYYGLDGRPITMEEWVALVESGERFVARTALPSGIWISTVLLGLDHGFGRGTPVIFKTMVFLRGDIAELDADRYATLEQAKAGHDLMVVKWTGWTPDEPMPGPDAMTVMFPKDAKGVADE